MLPPTDYALNPLYHRGRDQRHALALATTPYLPSLLFLPSLLTPLMDPQTLRQWRLLPPPSPSPFPLSSSSSSSLPSPSPLPLPLPVSPARAASIDLVVVDLRSEVADPGFDPTKVVQLSWKPRVFLYKGFLSDGECDHLISLAKGKLRKSLVADTKTGKSLESNVRTSSGMFLSKGMDGIISRIEHRIATWTLLPEEYGEGIQILHYENGQKYEPHFDYFLDEVNVKYGGQRLLTVLMYLSNVKRGGETIFPNAEEKNSRSEDEDWSDCTKNGYAVKPEKGDAILFFSLHPDGTTDASSLHGGCPVLEGEKWSATKWVHVRRGSLPDLASILKCEDKNYQCPLWAARGECKKNPAYMIGSNGTGGTCRKSCHACSYSPSLLT